MLLVPRWPCSSFAGGRPQWWHHLGQCLAEKVRALFVSLEDMAILAAPQRVACRLLAMAHATACWPWHRPPHHRGEPGSSWARYTR